MALVWARHRHVHVQALDALPSRRDACVIDEVRVARLLDDRLLLGVGKRMRARSGDREPVRGGCVPRRASKRS